MLNDLGQLEQRARHLYAPTMTSQSNGHTIHQCELVRDELAEARERMRYHLAPVAFALVMLAADVAVAPRYFMRWLRQWRRTEQIG
jgi:hypothetical protein